MSIIDPNQSYVGYNSIAYYTILNIQNLMEQRLPEAKIFAIK